MLEKPIRRMTLQELLTQANKNIRDLTEFGRSGVLASLADLRDLSRPVRRRSRYPTFIAVQNSLSHFLQTQEQNLAQSQEMLQVLLRIRQLARKDLQSRGQPVLAQRESA